MLGLYARTTTPGLISFLNLELGSGIYISTSFNILFLAPHPFFITLLLLISIIVSWHYYFVVMEFTTLCHGVYYLTAISLKISRILLLKKKTTSSLSPYPMYLLTWPSQCHFYCPCPQYFQATLGSGRLPSLGTSCFLGTLNQNLKSSETLDPEGALGPISQMNCHAFECLPMVKCSLTVVVRWLRERKVSCFRAPSSFLLWRESCRNISEKHSILL